MAISSGKLRQSIVLLVVIGVVGALLSVYFFVYIHTKEDHINRRNFNALVKSAQNIQQKMVEYATKKVTWNYLKYNVDYILGLEEHKHLITKENVTELARYLKYEIEVKDKHELTVESLTWVDNAAGSDLKNQKGPPKNGTIEMIDQTFKFVFKDTLALCLKEGANCADCKCKSWEQRKYFARSTIPVHRFIEPLLHRDIFSEYVIVNPAEAGNKFTIYESHPLGGIDSLKAALKSSHDEVRLNGITYKIFRAPFSMEKYNWILIGLQDREQYLKDARSFDLFLLYIILIVAIILLLGLPLIKVILISRNEKLNKSDVILCGVSLLMGCFFWTIIISEWDYRHLYREDVNQRNVLEVLSTNIENEFSKEINLAYRELLNAENSCTNGDLVKVGSLATKCDSRDSTTHRKPYEAQYKDFEVISWIDSMGKQTQKWATNYKATRKLDVSGRAYFYRVRDSLEWMWKGQKIVLESIRSWNTSEYLAAISKASAHRFPVLAITTSLRSVIHCTLPHGYKFCITDQQGNVWFHSDANKNLSENIFEECDIDPSINMVLYSTGKKSAVLYENKKHQINIRPLTDLPLFLITMKDLSVEDQSKVYVLQVTFVFLLIHVLIISLAVLIIALTWKRSLKRHVTVRSLDWLRPDEDRIKLYLSIGFLNLAIAVLLLIFVFTVSPLNVIIILLLTPLYVFPVYYLSLNNQTIKEFLKPVNQTLLGGIIFTIIIFNIGFFITFETSWKILAYQALLLGMIIPWLIFASFLRQKSSLIKILRAFPLRGKILKAVSLRTAYSLAFSSLCVIVGIIPVFVFHHHAFNLERIKNIMVTQYEIARESSSKPKNRHVYLVNGMDRGPISRDTSKSNSPEDYKDFVKLTKLVSPVMDTAGIGFIKRGHLFYSYVQDKRWLWSMDSTGRLAFTPDGADRQTDKASLRSSLHTYHSPQLIGWTLGFLGIVWLFVAARYLTGRIFIFDVNRNLVEADLFIVQSENKKIDMKDREQLMEPLLNNHLFIIGLPFSGEREYIDKIHPPDRSKRLVVDLVEVSNGDQWNTIISEAADEKYEVIIIDHFEHDFQSSACNNLKLTFMEKLFLMWKKKIVVLSTIHPSQLQESYEGEAKCKERWNVIFSHFYNIYYPLQKEKLSKEAILKEYGIDEKKWDRNEHFYEFIEKECSHGLFLQNLKPAMYSLVDIANKNKLTIEELSDKVKSLAYTYYASVWSSCSKDERFLIYDLAEDGLVNIKNDECIVQLIYKGIFVQKRTLSIMNRSFRNFVLSYVNSSEVQEMRKETLSYGTWSGVKGPIIFILAIAILFLLYTQKGFSNQIMAFLSTIAAGIPLILKLMTLVDTQAKPKEKST